MTDITNEDLDDTTADEGDGLRQGGRAGGIDQAARTARKASRRPGDPFLASRRFRPAGGRV